MVETATRIIKLETIFRAVKDCNKCSLPAKTEAIISICGKTWGMRRQSAQELLKSLVADEAIVIDGEEIWTYERWEKIKTAHEKDYAKGKTIINKTFAEF